MVKNLYKLLGIVHVPWMPMELLVTKAYNERTHACLSLLYMNCGLLLQCICGQLAKFCQLWTLYPLNELHQSNCRSSIIHGLCIMNMSL